MEVQIAVHYHIGSTGGTFVQGWFSRQKQLAQFAVDSAWEGPWNRNFSMVQNPHVVDPAWCSTGALIEFHCGPKLETTIGLIEEIKSLAARCRVPFFSFTVVRNPLDQLCSSQAHEHSDYESFLNHDVRNHMTSIAAHGRPSCARMEGLKLDWSTTFRMIELLRKLDYIVDIHDLNAWLQRVFNVRPIPGKQIAYSCMLPANKTFPVFDMFLYSQLVTERG